MEELTRLRQQLIEIKERKAKAISEQTYEMAAQLRDQERELFGKLEYLINIAGNKGFSESE